MIENIHRGILGTVCFDAKFPTMRKSQEWIVYPVHSGASATRVMIQSNTRIGWVDLISGAVSITPARAGGSYGCHLHLAQNIGRLDFETLFMLSAQIMASAHGDAGRTQNRAIGTDNAGALDVFPHVGA